MSFAMNRSVQKNDMKVVILAGGYGSRLSEETVVKPKPMIEIGGKPILWHIMKIYAHYGYTEFVICLGYKGYMIKEYFANYFLHQSDVTIDFKENKTIFHHSNAEPWTVTMVDTGDNTLTGGRIKRVREYLNDKTFMMTYGDGVATIDIDNLVAEHQKSGRLATITAVQPMGRFGSLTLNGDDVQSFVEKPAGDGSWINGGFFVCEQKVFDYIDSDQILWEKEPLENLARDNQLNACRHDGFWKPIDTLRDKKELEKLWQSIDSQMRLN